jgi:hypothetical protein
MSARPNRPHKQARTRLTKAEKYLLRARAEGISHYEEMAKQYTEGRKTRTRPTIEEIRWRKAKRAHTKGVIGGTTTNLENNRLNRYKEVADALNQFYSNQPKWKKRAKAFSLLFGYMLPHIRIDIHQQTRLREILREREALYEANEKYGAQQPISVGDVRKILMYAAREYGLQILALSKSEADPRRKFSIRESARTQQEEILHIQNQLENRLSNSTLNARQQESLGLRPEWFNLAIICQLRSFDILIGKTETGHVSGAEWVLQNWMRTQNNLKPEENDPQGRGEWENPR